MAEENMARVKVNRNAPVRCYDEAGNELQHVGAYYEAGQTYTAPRSHIKQIVDAGAGEEVSGEEPQPQQQSRNAKVGG